MERKLENRKIALTGAGGGIGAVIARRLAAGGASLALLGGRDEERLAAVRDGIVEAYGTPCVALPGDLTVTDVRDAAADEAVRALGGIDVLINCAGLAHGCSVEDVTEELYDLVMTLDVKVPYFLTQRLLPHLRESEYGTVVNVASVTAHAGYPNQSVYSAAKHALLGFSKSLASEEYKNGVRVHVISPGGVYSDMIKVTRPDLDGTDMIMPEDVAEAVAFLLENRGHAVIDEIIMHRVGKEPFNI